MIVSSAANRIVYDCGCICEWQLIGGFAYMKEWHIISCLKHAKDYKTVERQADIDWERITSEVRG